MKHLILPIVFFLCGINLNHAQCPTSHLVLENQSVINNFPINYPRCTNLTNGLTIGKNVDNLLALSNIVSINGDLIFDGCKELSNMDGLNNLTYVSGNLILNGCKELSNLIGLENLTSIGGDLRFETCAEMSNMDGLENLQNIGGDLVIEGCKELNNLNAFAALNVVGDIFVEANKELNNCTGLCHVLMYGIHGDCILNDNQNGCNEMNALMIECQALLPLIWFNFQAKLVNNVVHLKWYTEGGNKNDTYLVEHSSNGMQYQVIGIIDNNFSNAIIGIEHSFIHESPLPGNNYYRIQHQSFDNIPDFSDVILVNYDIGKELFIYPQPCVDKLHIYYPGSETLNVSILDMNGIVMLNIESAGETIEIGSLVPGAYILQVFDGFIKHTRRFFKIAL